MYVRTSKLGKLRRTVTKVGENRQIHRSGEEERLRVYRSVFKACCCRESSRWGSRALHLTVSYLKYIFVDRTFIDALEDTSHSTCCDNISSVPRKHHFRWLLRWRNLPVRASPSQPPRSASAYSLLTACFMPLYTWLDVYRHRIPTDRFLPPPFPLLKIFCPFLWKSRLDRSCHFFVFFFFIISILLLHLLAHFLFPCFPSFSFFASLPYQFSFNRARTTSVTLGCHRFADLRIWVTIQLQVLRESQLHSPSRQRFKMFREMNVRLFPRSRGKPSYRVRNFSGERIDSNLSYLNVLYFKIHTRCNIVVLHMISIAKLTSDHSPASLYRIAVSTRYAVVLKAVIIISRTFSQSLVQWSQDSWFRANICYWPHRWAIHERTQAHRHQHIAHVRTRVHYT